MSDDGDYGLTIIAFIGSVFSPYYRLARRRGRGDPENHVAINVCLYGAGGKRWAMTERGRPSLDRSTDRLRIGPSALRWEDGALIIDIDEIGVPIPRRLRGRVRLTAPRVFGRSFPLDAARNHLWRPIAPSAHVEVQMEAPALTWSGHGYFDMNAGAEPLEDAFVRWDWSRARAGDDTLVLYDALRRDGSEMSLALRCAKDGKIWEFEPPPRNDLPMTGWRIARSSRADERHGVVVNGTLEDTPFYARSLIGTRLVGHDVTAFHESLSLDRFRSPAVQCMLPFRMPRRG